jgi:hypothetical protein
MKKLLSILTTFILVFSLMACTNKNTAMKNNQTGTNSNTPKSGSTNSSSAVGKYNNGIYVGQSNINTSGSETAIVTIRDGAIDNVELLKIDNTGRIMDTHTPNYSSATEPNSSNINAPNGTITTPNTTAAPSTTTVPGTTIASGTGDGTGTVTDGTGLPNTNISSRDNNTANNTTNNLTNNNTASNNTTNNADVSLASAKKDLINNVINSQTADVNINVDGSVKTSIDNWKTAIQNALNKAA